MDKVTIGKKVPDFELPASGGKSIRLSDFSGSKLVVYFYPRDNTPGCTREGEDFKSEAHNFERHNVRIVGVSRDSVDAHEKFKQKYRFPFDLLSDSDATVCALFDVIKPKVLYGRTVRGIERSTFLIDEKGILIKEWRKVRVKNHVDEVLKAVQNI